jgi:hypothetical protein
MPTSNFLKFNSFVEAVCEKKHDLGVDQLQLALTNTLPVNTNTVLTNITEIAYTFLSGNPGSRQFTATSSVQTSGVYALKAANITLTASGGNVGPFQYIVMYNNAATNKELIGWYDYAAPLTLGSGESLTITFDPTGILTLQ